MQLQDEVGSAWHVLPRNLYLGTNCPKALQQGRYCVLVASKNSRWAKTDNVTSASYFGHSEVSFLIS